MAISVPARILRRHPVDSNPVGINHDLIRQALLLHDASLRHLVELPAVEVFPESRQDGGQVRIPAYLLPQLPDKDLVNIQQEFVELLAVRPVQPIASDL